MSSSASATDVLAGAQRRAGVIEMRTDRADGRHGLHVILRKQLVEGGEGLRHAETGRGVVRTIDDRVGHRRDRHAIGHVRLRQVGKNPAKR